MHKEAHGDLNACNDENWYPMHTAVQHNQINALKYLLENKANCSTVAYSKTPLHVGKWVIRAKAKNGGNTTRLKKTREMILMNPNFIAFFLCSC